MLEQLVNARANRSPFANACVRRVRTPTLQINELAREYYLRDDHDVVLDGEAQEHLRGRDRRSLSRPCVRSRASALARTRMARCSSRAVRVGLRVRLHVPIRTRVARAGRAGASLAVDVARRDAADGRVREQQAVVVGTVAAERRVRLEHDVLRAAQIDLQA